MNTDIHARLISEMIAYYRGDPRRVQHFLKVCQFAGTIAALEGLSEGERFVLQTAAIVHDIGIRESERKYKSAAGKYQELEGPPVARALLTRLGFAAQVTERVCYLVGHHHTYSGIDGPDYQILVEADFLVNLYEDQSSKEAAQKAYERIFKTDTGRRFCRELFGCESYEPSDS